MVLSEFFFPSLALADLYTSGLLSLFFFFFFFLFEPMIFQAAGPPHYGFDSSYFSLFSFSFYSTTASAPLPDPPTNLFFFNLLCCLLRGFAASSENRILLFAQGLALFTTNGLDLGK